MGFVHSPEDILSKSLVPSPSSGSEQSHADAGEVDIGLLGNPPSRMDYFSIILHTADSGYRSEATVAAVPIQMIAPLPSPLQLGIPTRTACARSSTPTADLQAGGN